MAQEELWPNFALKIGKEQREIYIIDDFLEAGAIEDIYRQFLAFPYVLGDSDRPDTTHVRHLVRTFDLKELEADTPLASFAQFVRRFLDANQLDSGPVSSLYANFNLHGDFQFTHEARAGLRCSSSTHSGKRTGVASCSSTATNTPIRPTRCSPSRGGCASSTAASRIAAALPRSTASSRVSVSPSSSVAPRKQNATAP